jgi:hypothetical protein
MATAQALSDGSKDLAYFQTNIQQEEGIYGPLTGLAAQAPNNVMTFTIGPSPDPAHRCVLDIFTDLPAGKAGYVLVCVGDCLVSGSTARVAAYRLK